MGNESSTMFRSSSLRSISNNPASRALVCSAVVSTAPIWLTALGIYSAIKKIHPPLGEAILRRLGLYNIANSDALPEDYDIHSPRQQNEQAEILLNRLALTGHYYNDMEGALQLAQPVNGNALRKGQNLLKKIEELSQQNFKDYDLDKLNVIPEKFLCPISLSIMIDPVEVLTQAIQKDKEVIFSHFYERKAIANWLEANKETDPLNRLRIVDVKEAPRLKQEIENFIKTNAPLKNDADLPRKGLFTLMSKILF